MNEERALYIRLQINEFVTILFVVSWGDKYSDLVWLLSLMTIRYLNDFPFCREKVQAVYEKGLEKHERRKHTSCCFGDTVFDAEIWRAMRNSPFTTLYWGNFINDTTTNIKTL